MRHATKRQRAEQERIAAQDGDYIRDRWFRALPAHEAILFVEENGVVIGTILAIDVHGGANGDLFGYLHDHEEFGPGYYSIAARYNGAFRGEHIRMQVGNPNQWSRGRTRAETQAFLDAERKKRARREEYQRNPFAYTVNLLADAGVLPGAPRQSPQNHRRREVIAQAAGTLVNLGEEDFHRACEMLRAELPGETAEAVFEEWRKLKAMG